MILDDYFVPGLCSVILSLFLLFFREERVQINIKSRRIDIFAEVEKYLFLLLCKKQTLNKANTFHAWKTLLKWSCYVREKLLSTYAG